MKRINLNLRSNRKKTKKKYIQSQKCTKTFVPDCRKRQKIGASLKILPI